MKPIHYFLGICLIGIALVLWNTPKPNDSFSGISSNTCTATTTAWTVGPGNSIEVLPIRYNRLAFSLSNTNNAANLFYRLDDVAATITNGIPLVASTTVSYDETYPVRGTVEVRGSVASSTIIVTECIY